MENAPLPPGSAPALGDEAAHGQRQTGGGEGQQHAIDVVGRLKAAHAPTPQQVAQWDLIQGPQQLADRYRRRQQGGTP